MAPLCFISLAMPNLVYSGVYWYDTLHLIKFFVAGVPVAAAVIVAGLRIALYGPKRISFKVDLFGLIWLGLIAYVTVQALWVPIRSKPGFVKELICFSAVWAFYVIAWNSFPGRTLRPLLWMANVNAAVNVVFAELQIRNLQNFTSLILPTPYNYIGNTGQQNMFGLWMAVCIISSIYLYIAYAVTPSGKKRHPAVTVINLLLMGVNIWGLWNSTSRSAILSLGVGLFVLGFITFRQFGRDHVKRLGHVLLLFALVLGGAMLFNYARAEALIAKTVDMLQNSETYGGRDGIWATSRTMFKMQPWSGVGLGQYKWRYLEAQKEMFKAYPDKKWQYTHWAHNEFLQWFCEGGIIGGLLLTSMWVLWGVSLLMMLKRKERTSTEVIWACALIALISFNALWTRPFHRIENILWLSLAFALYNRATVPVLMPKTVFTLGGLSRPCGIILAAAAVGGVYFLADGMVGDRLMRQALATRNAALQRSLLEQASTHLMVGNEAQKNLGYHYMQVGELSQDIQSLSKGFQLLWQHFLREPHSEELRYLMDWAQRFQSLDVLKTLVGYLKPGTYRMGIQSGVTDNLGNVVSAVIVIPLEDSGGMKIISPTGNSEEMPSSDEWLQN